MLFSAHCSTLVPYWQKGKVLLTKIKKTKERRNCCAGKSEIKMGVEVRIGSKLVGGEGERGSKCWSVDRGGGRGRDGTKSKCTSIPLCTIPYTVLPNHIVLVCAQREGGVPYQTLPES